MSQVFNYFSNRICYFLFGFEKIPFWLHYFFVSFIFYDLIRKLIKKTIFRLAIICLPCIVIFIKLTRNDFFFQSDDFAHFRIVADYSFLEIFKKTMTQGFWGFHHIFLGFWVFKIIYMFFGTNFIAYSLAIFILHLVNIILLYFILEKTKKTPFNILIAFLFSTFYLFWIADIWELTTCFFLLLSLSCWLNFLKKYKRKDLVLAFLAFLLALFGYEKIALVPLVFFLFSIFYNFYLVKINFRRVILSLFPFLVVSVFHFLIYGRSYFRFFSLTDDAYKAKFSLAIVLKNILIYLTQLIPLMNRSLLAFLVFVIILLIFDFWKKKLIVSPLFLSYLILLSPAVFLEVKISPYYTYIPSIFLYILFLVLFNEVYLLIKVFFRNKKNLFLKVLNIYFLLFILIGIFKIDRFFLDNCFLIQFPWPNPHRLAFNSIITKINNLFAEGKIKDNQKIKLEEKEITHEMKYFFRTDSMHLFLDNQEAKNYTFEFSASESALIVKKRPYYQKISY